MPLNHDAGEILGDLGPTHLVLPYGHWDDTNFFELACLEAERRFVNSGALIPVRFDRQEVVIQLYPKSTPPRLAFIFAKQIAGQEKIVPVVMPLDKEMIDWIKETNRWPVVH